MADEQLGINLSQQPTANPNRGPIENLQGDAAYLAKAFQSFADAINQNPDLFKNIGINATTEFQSNVTESKWKMSKENPKEAEKKAKGYKSKGNLLDDFEQGIKDQLLDSLVGGNFKKGIQGALDQFQKEFGFDLKNIGHEAGKELTKKGVDAFKNSDFGKEVIGNLKQKAGDFLKNAYKDNPEKLDQLKNIGQSFLKNAQGAGGGQGGMMGELLNIGGAGGTDGSIIAEGSQGAGSIVANGGESIVASGGGGAGAIVAEGAGTVAAEGAGAAAASGAGAAGATAAGGAASGFAGMISTIGPIISQIGTSIAAMNPYLLAIIAAIAIIAKCAGPLFESIGEMVKALGKSFNRDEEMRKKRMENAQKRLEADIQYMAKRPFEILQDAAETWSDTWNSNLREIGQTQGYDKETTYKLYESYAQRLRSEGLGSVINATDVVDKLGSVLESGLSGQAAEEFAYVATKLSAAIPTQDFFSFADTYASVAANAIAQGQSQEEALALANDQLEQFASNLLYSSRELAGGFSTGLKNSESLFKDAVQIAQSAKTNNAADISGALTSVSAIIGAVAPDMADSLVSNVVDAAIGGNSETIVALRSLAGINAGNTEFLQAIAKDPKSVFSELFSNLAELQNMSPDNYMEVAEGLAGIFGIDKAAFARVDFNYLAKAINEMNLNNASLDENMKLLQSGQTTTSDEQLKAQEINRVILDEGLAYVIDSEAGRMIQQHMWDEQIANELEETTYAVEIQGAALQFLEGIRKTVTNLLNFLNPIGALMKGVSNMMQSTAEAMSNDQDIREILELGAVGKNAQALSNLTTRGKDLNLTKSLVEMMGGQKGTALGNFLAGSANLAQLGSGGSGLFNALNDAGIATPGGLVSKVIGNAQDTARSLVHALTPIQSRYDWGVVGKSVAKAVQETPMNTNTISSVVRAATTNATNFAQEQSNKKFQEFINSAKEASKTMNYSQWVESSKNFGISNFEDALEMYGHTAEELKAFFEENETAAGAAEKERREQSVRDFWGYDANGNGVFYNVMWSPFFGEGMKYDTRMDMVDEALSIIQSRIGLDEEHTVIGGLEEISRKLGDDTTFTVIGALDAIEDDIARTFMSGSTFQKCLNDYVSYMANRDNVYYGKDSSKGGLLNASAWANLKSAEGDKQNQTLLALAKAMEVFSADQLKNLDPQLQANALLGEIVIILQAIMQQNNTQAGGLSLMDTISALGLGATKK